MKNRVGEIHGNYLVLELDRVERNKPYWKCKCLVCGAIKVRYASYFKKDKETQHCEDCSWKRSFKGYEEIPQTYWNRVLLQAKQRKIPVTISIEEAWSLYEKQNRKCIYTGEPILFGKRNRKIKQTASLDRVDSSRGYTKDNVQWVHKDINIMKGSLSSERFVYLCSKVKEPIVPEVT